MRGRQLKILGLSFLALVGVMAVSASAARAEWLLLLNKVSVLKQTFKFTVNPTVFAVPNLGIEITCEGGTGTDFTELDGTHESQSGAAVAEFTGCEEVEHSETCTVMSPGSPDGTLTMAGAGGASMKGENVLIDTGSEEFAKIEFLGEECPLTEIDGTVSGSVTVEIGTPLVDSELHTGTVVKYSLSCASNEVTFQAVGGGLVTGSIKTTTGGASATHLVGL